MKRRKKWRPGGRPRTPVTAARGSRRQKEKNELRLLLRKEEMPLDRADIIVPAAGAGGYVKSLAG